MLLHLSSQPQTGPASPHPLEALLSCPLCPCPGLLPLLFPGGRWLWPLTAFRGVVRQRREAREALSAPRQGRGSSARVSCCLATYFSLLWRSRPLALPADASTANESNIAAAVAPVVVFLLFMIIAMRGFVNVSSCFLKRLLVLDTSIFQPQIEISTGSYSEVQRSGVTVSGLTASNCGSRF